MKRVIYAFVLTIFSGSLLMGQVNPGDAAPAFSLTNVDGKTVSLSDYADQEGVIVIFTCNPCPFAIKYEQRIINLHKNYGEKGFPVVAINPNDEKLSPDDTMEKMQERAKSSGYEFPYLKDDGTVYAAYGATRTPHVYLLSNDGGEFTVEFVGAIDNNAAKAKDATKRYVQAAIKSLKAGESIKETQVKAIGCTIKRKA